MKFTQAQVRHLVEIGEEKFRTWRCALSPLTPRRGQSPLFNLGDVLALRLIRELVDSFGVKISQLSATAPELFDACDRVALNDAGSSLLVLTPSGVEMTHRLSSVEIDGVTIVLPVARFLDDLKARITAEVDKQATLPL